MNASLKDVTVIILAGGRGQRMMGQNKGLTPLNGRPMISYVLESIPKAVDNIIISANEDIEAYRAFNFPVLPDRYSEFQGPLAGIHACLQETNTLFCQLLPCDAPFVPSDLIETLNRTLLAEANEACIPFDTRLQPLFMQMKTEVRTSLQAALEKGERKVLRWIEQLDYSRVDFSPDTQAFTNINTPDMLQNAEKALQQH